MITSIAAAFNNSIFLRYHQPVLEESAMAIKRFTDIFFALDDHARFDHPAAASSRRNTPSTSRNLPCEDSAIAGFNGGFKLRIGIVHFGRSLNYRALIKFCLLFPSAYQGMSQLLIHFAVMPGAHLLFRLRMKPLPLGR